MKIVEFVQLQLDRLLRFAITSISKYPVVIQSCCWIGMALLSIGLINVRMDNDAARLLGPAVDPEQAATQLFQENFGRCVQSKLVSNRLSHYHSYEF